MKFTKEDTLALKGIAIIMMLFHHTFPNDGMVELYNVIFTPFSEGLINNVSWFGKECVAIFAFLSAYGLTISFVDFMKQKNKSLKEWYLIRLMTLYKGYWFIFMLALLIGGAISKLPWVVYFANGETDITIGLLYLVLDLLGISTFFNTPSMNGAWWYMGIAVMIIMLVPILVKTKHKIGATPMLVITVIFPRIFGIPFQGNNAFLSFFFIIICGVICADGDLFIQYKGFCEKTFLQKIIKFVVMSFVIYVVYHLFMIIPVGAFYEINYGIIPLIFMFYAYEYVVQLPVIRNIFCFLGRHSMNIFYVHIFVRVNYGTHFMYSFQWFAFIILVLLVSSIIISFFVEMLKKIVRYDRFWSEITKRLVIKVCKTKEI